MTVIEWVFAAMLAVSQAQVLQEPPKGLAPNLGRPTKPEDAVPLLDFDQYFLGKWTFTADAPDSALGPGGVSTGLSGLFVPVEALPSGLQWLAKMLPMTYIVSLLSGIWTGESWFAHLGDLAALAIAGMLFLALSARVFRWE